MVGLIQKLMLNLIAEQGGEEAMLEVKRRAGVPADKVFRMNEVYDDGEFRDMRDAAIEVLGLGAEELELAYADYFCRDAIRSWPKWFEMSANSRELIARQPTIHNGFATSCTQDPEARSLINDKFHLTEDGDTLKLVYRSPNHLCGLYVKLAKWIIDHYGDAAEIEEHECQKSGAEACVIEMRWTAYKTGVNQ